MKDSLKNMFSLDVKVTFGAKLLATNQVYFGWKGFALTTCLCKTQQRLPRV